MTRNLQADGVQSRQTLFVRYCHKSLLPDNPKAGSYNCKGCIAQMHLKENILQHEQHRQNIHQRFHLLALAANQMQYYIGDDPDGDAL